MTRPEALAAGEKFYNGHPCGKCGAVERYVGQRQCVACAKTRASASYRRNPPTPDRRRTMNLRSRYGMTVADFDALWRKQTGACAICTKPLVRAGGGGAAVDHCHKSSRVRGLLCMPCNTGIGKLREDPAIFHAALRYLELHRSADRHSQDTQ